MPLLVFFTVFLMLAGWFFALSRIYLIKGDILSLRRELLENKKNEEDAKSLRNIFSDIEEKEVKINSLFLNENGLVHLIEGLESLGKSSGAEMKMNSVSADKGKNRAFLSRWRGLLIKFFNIFIIWIIFFIL